MDNNTDQDDKDPDQRNKFSIQDIRNDPEAIEEIISTIGRSEKEPIKVYKSNKVERITALVTKAGLTIQEYEEALSFTKTGYKVAINLYNVE